MENQKISLSMKEVDQNTGEDLNPQVALPATANDSTAYDTPWMNPESANVAENNGSSYASSSKKVRVRQSTPDRWEYRQMMNGGGVTLAELPDFDEDLGILKSYDGVFFIIMYGLCSCLFDILALF